MERFDTAAGSNSTLKVKYYRQVSSRSLTHHFAINLAVESNNTVVVDLCVEEMKTGVLKSNFNSSIHFCLTLDVSTVGKCMANADCKSEKYEKFADHYGPIVLLAVDKQTRIGKCEDNSIYGKKLAQTTFSRLSNETHFNRRRTLYSPI